MNKKLSLQKTILVTGAARGLGRAMTLALAKSGFRVGAIDLAASSDLTLDLINSAKSEGFDDLIFPIFGDITNEDDCSKIVQDCVARFGQVHGLVNNAGRGMQDIGPVLVGQRTKFYEVDPSLWRGVVDTNLNGPFIITRAIVPHFLSNGWGRVVNIVTSFSTMQAVGFSPYGPTKAALEASTSIWAKDLSDTGVTVNALLPGRAANTRMIPESEITDRASLVQPEEMGPPIIWLMSTESDGVTGKRFIARGWNTPVTQNIGQESQFVSAGFPS
jgi:NAD(P)-dependent dehydrogenase (short-subunit alcohol dehydrogenase family)